MGILNDLRAAFDGEDVARKNIMLRRAYDALDPAKRASSLPSIVTDEMVSRALNAWFDGPQSESDAGLERGMRAAIEAAISPAATHPAGR